MFAEKGYDAATMTEIAARADAAIGSLYQFFPSKEALADALLARYAERFDATLQAIAGRGAGMSPDELAGALVQMMLDLQSERSVALVLADAATTGRSEIRAQFRRTTRERLTAVLRTIDPALAPAQARTRAIVLLPLLKTVPALAKEEAAGEPGLLAELRALVRLAIDRGSDSASPNRR